MIHNIASSGVHAADIAALRQARAKKTAPAPDNTGETDQARKSAHRHGHIPPGLARAAERIASKIFERADADASGTVTREELSAVHSKHARTLASSDLFQTNSNETPTDAATETATETATTATIEPGASDPSAETPTTTPTETTTETPAPTGVTEAQLKEALTRFFYAKVGITYTPPAPTITEPPDPAAPTNTTTPPVVDPTSEEPASSLNFTAVA